MSPSYCLRLFVVVFQGINCLNLPIFVRSQSFISLPSFMFVSAPGSEICELNQNKKKKKEKIELFNTFPGHISF